MPVELVDAVHVGLSARHQDVLVGTVADHASVVYLVTVRRGKLYSIKKEAYHEEGQGDKPDEEEWILTYADAITLLMAFFVMLLTFAKFDIPSFEEVRKGISEAVGHRDNEPTPTELLKVDVEDAVATMQAEEVTKITKDEKGIVIELDSSAFYKPGSAEILKCLAAPEESR